MPLDLQDQLSKMKRDAQERDAERQAQLHSVGYLSPQKISINLEALALIPQSTAQEAHAAIIEARDKHVALIVYDPKYSKTVELIKTLEQSGYTIKLYVVSLPSLQYAFDYYKFVPKKREVISGAVSVKESSEGQNIKEESISTLSKVQDVIKKFNNAGKVTELVETVLLGALANRASDIHFEPRDKTTKLRYRIDGVLNDIFGEFSPAVYKTILSRIKLLSNLKLNVRDEPQDGRFTIQLQGKNVEVRVALAPSEFGEVIVMRLLDPDAIALSLADLGLRQDDLKIIEEQLARPNGMAINTGPTGSGKTTTLYAFLKHKLNPGIKIITIEDPIEYHLDGIEQTQVNAEAGYTFASGLRSLMRQDPDVILVGEVRDKETAEIAVQAALTGHLVFSTVHANSASAGIPRLLDLGVKSISLAPALNLLIAQRLVRRLCTSCRVAKEIDSQTKAKLEAYVQALPSRVKKEPYLEKIEMYEPKGCEVCNNTGYKGRVGVYELLVITPAMQELITKQAGQIEIEKSAMQTDFVSMQQDGVLKVIRGVTTFEEVEEVTGKIEWERNETSS